MQEIEARETRIDSETAALLAKSMSLYKELTEKMEEFSFMRERMTALRKKNKDSHSNIIDKLRKISKKYPFYEQGANTGPENAHPKVNEEDDDKEIIYKPPFLGHLKRGE